jgi:hypothetical protein
MGRSPIWVIGEDFGHPYNGYSPFSAGVFSAIKVGRIDPLDLAPLRWGKQRMPGSCKRGIVTMRRFFCVLRAGGSALREPWLPYQKINERKTGSLAMVAKVPADTW